MKTALKLTLALVLPFATACVAQATTAEDVNASQQDLTAETTPGVATATAQPNPGANAITTEQRNPLARQFTTTTVVTGPTREMESTQDPTTPPKVDGVDPVPVPWDPTRVLKR